MCFVYCVTFNDLVVLMKLYLNEPHILIYCELISICTKQFINFYLQSSGSILCSGASGQSAGGGGAGGSLIIEANIVAGGWWCVF